MTGNNWNMKLQPSKSFWGKMDLILYFLENFDSKQLIDFSQMDGIFWLVIVLAGLGQLQFLMLS